MTPSTLSPTEGIHAAIIMDGNGRWARARGMPRLAGHRAGADALRRVVEAAPEAGIRALTVYAFSQDNWKRPADEVRGLFALLEDFLRSEVERCEREGVELRSIGRRDRLPWSLAGAIAEAEHRTRRGRRLTLRVALDYSSRDAIAAASERAHGDTGTREAFAYWLAEVYGDPGRRLPDVDLLIRTAGEQRLSDFLLWEAAYAELHFTETLWPDFGTEDLRRAMYDFQQRRRTYGGLPVCGVPANLPAANSLPQAERRSA